MKIKILLIVSVLVILNSSFLIHNCFSQWEQCDGIYGGDVYSLAISGNNTFAGTGGYCVYLSTNNGIDGRGNELWFVRQTQVYRSTDGGSSWTSVHSTTLQ